MRFTVLLRVALLIAVSAPVLGRSAIAPANQDERVRAFTRSEEFDYISWTADALLVKLAQGALGASRYIPVKAQHNLVLEYLQLVQEQIHDQEEITSIYSDPDEPQPAVRTVQMRIDLKRVTDRLKQIGPFAETILQSQIDEVLASRGLTTGGQPVPPVWYHTTPLPMALIVSPRSTIRSDVNVSLEADLPLEQIIAIEDQVSGQLNLSALVVPVGGIGIYPTMVMRTDNLNWLAETISHEWAHNYLTIRPLGLFYEASPELRTMNETTANIVGTEIGEEVIQRYYPELVPKPSNTVRAAPQSSGEAPIFSYRAEMRSTRVTVDRLLAEGQISEAERYMESQRRLFFDNGYPIRKLNQAYFAFYGAYADQPGGAAGEDPVGPAVRELRERSASLADFLNKISWMTSFDQLKQAVR